MAVTSKESSLVRMWYIKIVAEGFVLVLTEKQMT